MAQSFFPLMPDDDDDCVPYICADCLDALNAESDADPHPEPSMGSLSYCDIADCASYTDEEHETIMDHAVRLSEALEDAIDAYADAHPELTYGMILHALDCTAYCVKEQMRDEDTADA